MDATLLADRNKMISVEITSHLATGCKEHLLLVDTRLITMINHSTGSKWSQQRGYENCVFVSQITT